MARRRGGGFGGIHRGRRRSLRRWRPDPSEGPARRMSSLSAPCNSPRQVAEPAPLSCASLAVELLPQRRCGPPFLPQAAAGQRQVPLHLRFPYFRTVRSRSILERAAAGGGFGPRRYLPCFSRSIGGPLVAEQQRPSAVKLPWCVDGEHGAMLVGDGEGGTAAMVLQR